MTTTILDGRTHDALKIDTKGRAQGFSTTQSEFTEAIKDGRAFIVNTGFIELTSANESAVLYIKNNEPDLISIHELIVQAGASSNGTTPDIIRSDYIGPTGGTIISEEKPLITGNLNPLSTKTLDIAAYKGREGDTLSGQVIKLDSFFYTSETLIQTTGASISKGGILAASVTPPAGNTSLKVVFSIFLYKQS